LIKAHINESSEVEVALAYRLNADLPAAIASYVKGSAIRVIQIATDCVFSGTEGGYTETSQHDEKDVYGTSKSEGEIQSPNFMNIRCSIVGPELKSHTSLFDWLKFQPKAAVITGFQNHIWNGVTTKAFAKLCLGIVEKDCFKAGVHHFVPADQIMKHDLLRLFAAKTGRSDVKIVPGFGQQSINRTLATNSTDQNLRLWNCAGYDKVPTIESLIAEL
jgi:dTDP-4-dehydrorhamnose reductase